MATVEKVETRTEKATTSKSVGLLDHTAVEEISGELRHLLADLFTLYLKTKNFHWHMTGKHFRDYHLLLDEQADQIFAMTDPVAERARKLGGITLHSIGEVASHQRLKDNNGHHLPAKTMLSELYADNRQLTASLRSTHNNVIATTTWQLPASLKSGSTRQNADPGSWVRLSTASTELVCALNTTVQDTRLLHVYPVAIPGRSVEQFPERAYETCLVRKATL